MSHPTAKDTIGGISHSQGRTFFVIADDLASYFETLDMAEEQLQAPGLTEAERADLEAGRTQMLEAIERLGGELATKADSLAGVVKRLKSEAEILSAEELRMTRRRINIERAEKWLKGYTIAIMNKMGVRTLRTTTTTLRIQGNGGFQPLEVTDFNLVPDCHKDIGVVMPLTLWQDLTLVNPVLEVSARQTVLEVSQKRVREVLAQRCETCAGEGRTEEKLCGDCHGTGHGTVPGARLLPRGEHLRIL